MAPLLQAQHAQQVHVCLGHGFDHHRLLLLLLFDVPGRELPQCLLLQAHLLRHPAAVDCRVAWP
jgi:hypothetical protein